MLIYFLFFYCFGEEWQIPRVYLKKESLEEKVVVREYELHLALEDIFNLKAELLKKIETNLDESKVVLLEELLNQNYPSAYYSKLPTVKLSMFILGCNVIQDEKGLSTGRGMVAFSSPEEASRALSELNCKILGGKPIYVTLALRKEDRRARLQNLEKGIDCKVVPETLSSFGNISCEVATDASGQSMGCGFVQFSGHQRTLIGVGSESL
ncbi:hypothetical protein ACS0TY_021185 [Phlomoides rotata]